MAVSLAQFGHDVSFVTCLPDNPVGQAALNSIRKYGVNTSLIDRSGDRPGIYFLEHGASARPSKVTYDRAGSSISQAKTGMFKWNEILSGKDWLHITGITPALSKSCTEVSMEAVQAAKRNNLDVI